MIQYQTEDFSMSINAGTGGHRGSYTEGRRALGTAAGRIKHFTGFTCGRTLLYTLQSTQIHCGQIRNVFFCFCFTDSSHYRLTLYYNQYSASFTLTIKNYNTTTNDNHNNNFGGLWGEFSGLNSCKD